MNEMDRQRLSRKAMKLLEMLEQMMAVAERNDVDVAMLDMAHASVVTFEAEELR